MLNASPYCSCSGTCFDISVALLTKIVSARDQRLRTLVMVKSKTSKIITNCCNRCQYIKILPPFPKNVFTNITCESIKGPENKE